ncbi:MAG TPA: hypothetical protein VEK74_02515 [Burkholderiaceae bacterium]|nr:hypothetical protein [Burkholderiaceae bacterium]
MTAAFPPPLALRREALRDALRSTADLIVRRRAEEIAESYIDD